MVDDFGEKLMHIERNLRKDGLNMTAFNRKLKFVNVYKFINVYSCERVHGPSSTTRVWNRQTKFTHNHWLAALVEGKCLSTKPTGLPTGVLCHPDTEQKKALQNTLALPGIELETYCTASENFTSVPHFS